MRVFATLSLVVTTLIALAGCGGAGGTSPFSRPDAGTVRISGKITYDSVPHAASGGLDYGQTQPRPARFVTVQFVPATGAPVTTRTDGNGDYSLDVPANTTGTIRAGSGIPGVTGGLGCSVRAAT